VTGRGSTPSTRAVPRRQGDGAFHRSARTRGCDGARFHAVYPRCPTSAGGWRGCTGQQAHAGVTGRGSTPSTRTVPRRQGDGAFHRSAGARGCDGARFHAVYPHGPTSAGGWHFSPVSRRTRGGQSEVPRRSFALSRASRGDSAVAPASRSTRGGQSEGPRRPSALSRASEGGQRGCTGQQEHAGRTERGSTPSICAIPRQRGG